MKNVKRSKTLTSRRFGFRAAYAIDAAMALFPVSYPQVLITGFWRSGTTWVQEMIAEALDAKTLFEPFSPKANPPFNRPVCDRSSDTPHREAFIPLDVTRFTEQDLKFLDAIFAGVCPARFAFLCRTSVSESFRRRAVIKMVRGQFVLPYLMARYPIRAVHVTRHPCAVVASLLNTDWDWSFGEVKFANLWPHSEALDASLKEDVAKLIGYDDRPAFERIAAYWAFTERQVARIQHERLLKVEYEPLVIGGRERFNTIINFLGGGSSDIDLDRNSVVTVSNRLNIPSSVRTDSWRKTLPLETQNRIEEVIADIWPEGAEHWFSPAYSLVQG